MSISTEYPDGIKAYEHYALSIVVHFPKRDVRCEWCPVCTYDRNQGSFKCAATGDVIYRKDKGVGINCPLEKLED